jgi:hypothetical protein
MDLCDYPLPIIASQVLLSILYKIICMVLCGKCEFSRRIKERNHLPRLEYECFADMPIYGSSTVMGVKNCSLFHQKIHNLEVNIKEFKALSEINPTSLTICANLNTYLADLDIKEQLNKLTLKWIDMMCNQAKALKEFTESHRDYRYVIGVEPSGDRQSPFEYHRIYIGDPASLSIRPKPNLITSRYGFYYAKTEAKKRYLKAWYDLLEINGMIVIYPYYIKTSPEIEDLDRFIDETFKNVQRTVIKKDLVRLKIIK